MNPRSNSGNRRGRGIERGFSLPEILVVLAMMGIFIGFAGPAFNRAYRAYKVRSAALELTDTLRAARQVAVSSRAPSSVVIDTTAKTYTYTDTKGRTRTIGLPDPVQFASVSPTTITFATNGTVTTGTAAISLTNQVSSDRVDQWDLALNTVGRVTSTYSYHTP